ncbi:MAG: ABC transporter permease subunit, partial [Comamonadaceae bacterium]
MNALDFILRSRIKASRSLQAPFQGVHHGAEPQGKQRPAASPASPIGASNAERCMHGSQGSPMIGVVIPNFLNAAILQLVFGVHLGWLPAGGWVSGSVAHLVLPVTVLAWPHAARISRLMRGSMIEVLGSNYVRTARAKGLGERLVLVRHAIKPALLPVVSYLGPGLSYLLTGSL